MSCIDSITLKPEEESLDPFEQPVGEMELSNSTVTVEVKSEPEIDFYFFQKALCPTRKKPEALSKKQIHRLDTRVFNETNRMQRRLAQADTSSSFKKTPLKGVFDLFGPKKSAAVESKPKVKESSIFDMVSQKSYEPTKKQLRGEKSWDDDQQKKDQQQKEDPSKKQKQAIKIEKKEKAPSMDNIFIDFMAVMAKILGQAEAEAHDLYQRVKGRTEQIDVLNDLICKINNTKGTMDWKNNPEGLVLIEKAKGFGVDIPLDKTKWTEEEKKLLKENIQIKKDSMEKISQLERTDMQRFLQEASQCHQARSNVLKLMKEVMDTIIHNFRS